MYTKSIERILVRGTLLAGGLSVFLAFAEGLAQLAGYSLVSRLYAPSRLLEIGGVLLIFAIALLLKEIRDFLAAKQG